MAIRRPRTAVGMLTAVGLVLLLAASVLAILKHDTAALVTVIIGAVVFVAMTALDVKQNRKGPTMGRRQDGWDGAATYGGRPSSQTNVPMRPGENS